MPPPARVWSELLMPRESPLAFFEMSYLLPHFLKEGRGKLAMYFTRVYNPVWTNPDGMSWIEMLTDEAKIERHACLTPIWSETAWFADYVLPMGHASERHDLMSQETHAARWIGFRQPVLRVALEKLTPLQYMRKYGAFLIEDQVYRTHEQPPAAQDLDGATVDPVTKVVHKGGQAIGVEIEGRRHLGFPTPSRKLEFFSGTLKAWKWPEQAVPNYIRSHVHWSTLDRAKGEMVLLPTFRLPTLIHTRSGNSKWLYEISHTNPLWLHPEDAAQSGVVTGDLLKVSTRIGHFVDKVWVTEAVRPGVVACSHHLGRWRLKEDAGGERWSSALVELQ